VTELSNQIFRNEDNGMYT